MTDQYPETIEFEVDRAALRAYLRTKWLSAWVGMLGFFGGAFGLVHGINCLERYGYHGRLDAVLHFARGVGTGLLISTAIALAAYLIVSHRPAARIAAGLRVAVEGAFLRIMEDGYDRRDRKLHFRSIVDYATVEGWLMRRFGLMMLQMNTTSGSVRGVIQITGLKDCSKVRDMLAEIDRIREKE